MLLDLDRSVGPVPALCLDASQAARRRVDFVLQNLLSLVVANGWLPVGRGVGRNLGHAELVLAFDALLFRVRQHALVFFILIKISFRLEHNSAFIISRILHKTILNFLRFGVIFHKILLIQRRWHIFHPITYPNILFLSFNKPCLNKGRDITTSISLLFLGCRTLQRSFNSL